MDGYLARRSLELLWQDQPFGGQQVDISAYERSLIGGNEIWFWAYCCGFPSYGGKWREEKYGIAFPSYGVVAMEGLPVKEGGLCV